MKNMNNPSMHCIGPYHEIKNVKAMKLKRVGNKEYIIDGTRVSFTTTYDDGLVRIPKDFYQDLFEIEDELDLRFEKEKYSTTKIPGSFFVKIHVERFFSLLQGKAVRHGDISSPGAVLEWPCSFCRNAPLLTFKLGGNVKVVLCKKCHHFLKLIDF